MISSEKQLKLKARKNFGVCNQCLDEKVLHKKSHIIPEFIFRSGNIYDGNDHSLVYFDMANNEDFGSTPTAPYEKHIFCKECEKYHSKIESRASRVFYHDKFDSSKIKLINRGLIATKLYEEIDPEALKLFLILLLFRANLSIRSSFSQVQLGPYQKKFREILNQEREVSKSKCNFYLYNFNTLIKNELNRLCSPFFRKKIENKTAYSFFIAGMGILYHFNKPTSQILEGTELTGENGTKVNLITKKKAAKIMLKSIFNFPDRIATKMLYG